MGLGIASVSYDGAALLRNFADRKDLHYPMLSDPESKMIRAFDILNDNFPKDHQWYGVPFPGMGQQLRFQAEMAATIRKLPRLTNSLE